MQFVSHKYIYYFHFGYCLTRQSRALTTLPLVVVTVIISDLGEF